jgi:hypothetical protein
MVYKYALNAGTEPDDKWGSWVTFNPGNCPGSNMIAWADVNNDGLDDFWCIGVSGSVSVSVNLGGNPPAWDGLHEVFAGPGGAYKSGDVRIAE